MFPHGIVHVTSWITRSSQMFAEPVVARSVRLSFVVLLQIWTEFAVYPIHHVPLSTSPIGDEWTDFTVTGISKSTDFLVKRTRLAETLAKCVARSKDWPDCQFLSLDVLSDLRGNFFRDVGEFKRSSVLCTPPPTSCLLSCRIPRSVSVLFS